MGPASSPTSACTHLIVRTAGAYAPLGSARKLFERLRVNRIVPDTLELVAREGHR